MKNSANAYKHIKKEKYNIEHQYRKKDTANIDLQKYCTNVRF